MRFIKIITLSATSAMLLASCVKSKDINFVNQATPSPNIVDFPNQREAASLDIVPTPTIYTIYVEASSQDNNLPATTVTIAKDVALVTSTKVDPNDTSAGAKKFEFLPDSAYTLVATTSTVDPVTHQAPFQLKINSSKIDLTHDFAVGFDITSTSSGIPISDNKKKILVSVLAKNKWDGEYTLDGTLVDYLAPANSSTPGDPYPYNVYLVTTGPNTDVMIIPPNTYFHLIAGGAVYGEVCPIFTFDGTTNKVTAVHNFYGDPSPSRLRSLALDPTGLNQVNADKSIQVKYLLKQNGVLKATFDETLTYVGKRP
jgi:hypothetical protein